MYKYLLPLLAACAPLEPTPIATPEPTPEPTPVPDPVLIVPAYILVGTPFAVALCDGPFKPGRAVTVDGKLLGTLGWNTASGCSQIVVPGLSGAGLRTIAADSYVAPLRVLPKR